ncbi:MAG: hypothetical protein H6604_00335 [Flavobacteriales bacterium]|nr:hypothetical protein [Flavobacteriales bacterium]
MKRIRQSFILLVGLFISISSQLTAQDNLGNHTATQNLDLATYQLVGNGGTQGISVVNNGNVGIGTNSPSAKLEINGGVKITNPNSQGSVYNFRNYITLEDASHVAIVYNSGKYSELMFGMHSNGNFYWGTGGSTSIKPNYYSMYLNGRTGELTLPEPKFKVTALGNVGIGTTSPDVKLHVNGTVKFQNLGTPTTLVNLLATDTAGNVFETPISSFSGGTITNLLTLNGTTLTSDVNGEISQVDLSSIDTNTDNQMLSLVGNTIEITGGNTIDLSAIIPNTTIVSNQINTNNELITTVNGVSSDPISLPSNGVSSTIWQVNNNEISLINDGNIRIGNVSNNDVIGNYKLSVDGKLWAEEIEVVETIAANGFRTTPKQWADKVFEEEYDLKDLQEVQKFIEENGHLPEIPSEKEVKENGVELLEMNVLLLQKVEELTLYILKQQQEIQEMKSRLDKVENK